MSYTDPWAGGFLGVPLWIVDQALARGRLEFSVDVPQQEFPVIT